MPLAGIHAPFSPIFKALRFLLLPCLSLFQPFLIGVTKSGSQLHAIGTRSPQILFYWNLALAFDHFQEATFANLEHTLTGEFCHRIIQGLPVQPYTVLLNHPPPLAT